MNLPAVTSFSFIASCRLCHEEASWASFAETLTLPWIG